MKRIRKILCVLCSAVIAALWSAACDPTPARPYFSNGGPSGGSQGETVQDGTPDSSAEGIPDRLTREEDKIAILDAPRPDKLQSAEWHNAYPFACTFRGSNVSYGGGAMALTLSKEGGNYYGAEMRTWGSYSYGYFSVSMKALRCSGVVSSFFTYTRNPWDEIDIEFLGYDTTVVQFNYYTNGVGGHEFLYRLGFDGAEDFHEYGFEWKSDCIIWYVDGKAVYKATKDIPSHAGQIMMNVWNGTDIEDWVHALDESGLPASAQYRWIGYRSA